MVDALSDEELEKLDEESGIKPKEKDTDKTQDDYEADYDKITEDIEW